MDIHYTAHFASRLQKRYHKNPPLRSQVVKQVTLFQQNPYHPSLKTHKLTGKRSEQYAFWIQGNLRITFLKTPTAYIFTDILTHDEY